MHVQLFLLRMLTLDERQILVLGKREANDAGTELEIVCEPDW